MGNDREEIDAHLQEVERLLRRIELEQFTRASRRERTNPSGMKRYGIGDARCDARHATAQVLAARQKLIGTAAVLGVMAAEAAPLQFCLACGTHTAPGSEVCMRKRGHRPPPGCIAAAAGVGEVDRG